LRASEGSCAYRPCSISRRIRCSRSSSGMISSS
jgi:hypothetical protein